MSAFFSNAKYNRFSGDPQFVYNDYRRIVRPESSDNGNKRRRTVSSDSPDNDNKRRRIMSSESLENGMRSLVSRVVKGAMHNSGERFDAPTCHPETRIALQDDILGWADELVDDLNEIVTWLYGPAGAGKSAIAQTIAQKLHERNQLTASFFFSRASGGEGRGAETDFVATLAYQLSQSIPATQPYIAATVHKNPLVFDLALQDQVTALIVAPLVEISKTASGTEKPRIIVVDGLDECRKAKDAQRRVVDALISGLRQMPHHTPKLFITSRPEHNIVSIFDNCEAKMLRRMELNDKWKPDDDIRTFLLAGFADIRRSHYYFQTHPVDKTWPTFWDVERLVRKSSGQFVYASVVLKYIKSEENYNPATRLEIILNLTNTEDQPYAELDALYSYIFSQIQDVESVLNILSLERLYTSQGSSLPPSLSTFLSEALGLEKGLIGFQLRPLSSLLAWSEKDGIRYNHASLPDFLLDKTRSGDFYINSLPLAIRMVSQVVQWSKDTKKYDIGFWLLWIPPYYMKMLPSDQRLYIWTPLSNFDVVETFLSRQDMVVDSVKLKFVKEYINWIFQSENAQEMIRIHAWFVDQFKLMNANYFNSPRIDIWPFLARGHGTYFSKITMDYEFASALEILEYPHSETFKVKASHDSQMNLLWFLMGTADWLGHCHAMTTERYAEALRRIVYYLLKLPKHKLVDALENYFGDETFLLIFKVIKNFLSRSSETTDLYFLLALVYPLIEFMHCRPELSAYIVQVIKKFPFLADPTSEDYIQACAKFKDTLIDLKIKSHLHEVAEGRQWTWPLEEKLPYRHLLETFAVVDYRVSQD